MKQRFAGSFILMMLFFQCGMNFPKKGNPIIQLEKDQFIDPEYISGFLEKLNQLKKSEGDSLLKIVHIGDSHIQMGHFSGEVRKALQEQFGGTGIGFFFPNSLCSGYNPEGLNISSESNWQCEKITNLESTIPLGLVGMAMKSPDATSSINIAFKGKKENIRMFMLLHSPLGENHEIRCPKGSIVTRNLSPNTALTVVTIQEEADEVPVYFSRKKSDAEPLIIYALSVNNPAHRGIDYNTFGVSGGQYKYFTKNTPLLAEQLEAIRPELMIVSLGSNDSYDKTWTKETYKAMVIDFVKTLKKASPDTEIILTTPPDTRYKNSKPASGTIVNQSIIEAGKQLKCTVWDFYTVMGGFDSYSKWKKKKYANKDGLHLSTDGYHLQGQLFNLALAKAMGKKFQNNDWLKETQTIVEKTLR